MASTDVMNGAASMHLAPLEDPKTIKQVPTRNGFGEGLLEAAKANKNVIGICADLSESTRMLALKETLRYLRGRDRESVIGELRAGAVAAGWRAPVPVYETEPEALLAELDRTPDGPEVLVMLCHAERDALFAMLDERGFVPVSGAELASV